MHNLYLLISCMLISCGDFSKEIERQKAEELEKQREEELKKKDETHEKILDIIAEKIKSFKNRSAKKNTTEDLSKEFKEIIEKIHQITEAIIKLEQEMEENDPEKILKEYTKILNKYKK